MARTDHEYDVTVQWCGNRGTGTSGYRDYGREHLIQATGKADIAGSSDPAFRGDAGRWNPEELLLASLSACHKLWYLHLCADAGLRVLRYTDWAHGVMRDDAAGGRFVVAVLRPQVTLSAEGDVALAQRLHHVAHEKCYIANSVNFAVQCEPTIEVEHA